MLEGLYKRRKRVALMYFYIVAGIFIVLALRLFMLQILAGGYYQAKAEGKPIAHGTDDCSTRRYV